MNTRVRALSGITEYLFHNYLRLHYSEEIAASSCGLVRCKSPLLSPDFLAKCSLRVLIPCSYNVPLSISCFQRK